MNKPALNKSTQNKPKELRQEEMFERLLKNQAEEIKLKGRELDIREKETDHNCTYALAALKAQKEDRKENRDTYKSIHFTRWIFCTVGLSFALAFSCFAIYMGKSDLVVEVLKMLVPSIVTGFGCYQWGKSKAPYQQRERED